MMITCPICRRVMRCEDIDRQEDKVIYFFICDTDRYHEPEKLMLVLERW